MGRGRPKVDVRPCIFCQKTFKRQEHLRRHERTHTQEKPYPCKSCDQRFSRKDLLARHTTNSHGGDAAVTEHGGTTAGNPPRDAIVLDEPMDSASSGREEYLPPSRLPRQSPDTALLQDRNDQRNLNPGATQVQIAGNPNHIEGSVSRYGHLNYPAIETHSGQFSLPVASSFGEPPELFADIDGFDWLWTNEFSNFHVPTQLMGNSSLDWGRVPPDDQVITRSENPLNSTYLNMSPRPSLELEVRIQTEGVANQVPAQYQGNSAINFSEGSREPESRSQPSTNDLQQSQLSGSRGVESAASRLDNELRALGDTFSKCPWRISGPAYSQLCDSFRGKSALLPPGYALPSRHTLSRFLEGYFRGFHEHLPFLHLPTLSVTGLPMELLLSLAAVGATYKFEPDMANSLYFAAKALVNHELQENIMSLSREPTGSSPSYSQTSSSRQPTDGQSVHNQETTDPSLRSQSACDKLRTMQALIVLTAASSWGQSSLVSDGLGWAGQLASIIRASGLSYPDIMSPRLCWAEWVEKEELRRTLLTGYALLNMQSIAFNVPPGLLSQEVKLCMPHPTNLWRASSKAAWEELKARSGHRERAFKDVLGDLLSGQEVRQPAQISAFGNFVLVHGLVQQIFMERQVISLRGPNSSFKKETLTSIDCALRVWQDSWSCASESTLDPLSDIGPLAFNSTALLRIAYIRLVADLGPHRSVLTRNPQCLAKSVTRTPITILERCSYTDLAILQCIHALGILVHSGIAFVSHTHQQNWSIIHALSNLECASLLNLWLQNLAEIVHQHGSSALRESERKLLSMIISVIKETKLGKMLQEQDTVALIRRVAVSTVRLWADALSGEHIFNMVRTIAEGLYLAADSLTIQLSS